MIIDTHVHLDDERYLDDIHDVLERAIRQGVQYFVIPGASLHHLPRAVELSERYDNIFFAVGLHPYDCHHYNNDELVKFITHPRCVAVGECGLDYYRLPDDENEKTYVKEEQEKVFRSHIQLAKQYHKPLIVHIRDASNDAKKILLEEKADDCGGVLHCFNADEQLLSLANNGFYFGIGGVVTFSNAKKLIQILPKIPLERLLLETDAPYLTPHPHRGTRNEPSYLEFIALKMEEVLGISKDEIYQITSENALKLFKFKEN